MPQIYNVDLNSPNIFTKKEGRPCGLPPRCQPLRLEDFRLSADEHFFNLAAGTADIEAVFGVGNTDTVEVEVFNSGVGIFNDVFDAGLCVGFGVGAVNLHFFHLDAPACVESFRCAKGYIAVVAFGVVDEDVASSLAASVSAA